MTTSVIVSMPIPNHKRVRIDHINIAADGTESVSHSVELNHGDTVGANHDLVVYDSRKLVITEIE